MTTAADIKNAASEILAEGARLDFTDRQVCVNNLRFMYHAMVASEDLLELAAKLDISQLGAYFDRHVKDERGHAVWLAEDLVEDGPGPFPALIPGMVGSQYYLIQHVDGCALLGYLLIMECFPMPLDRVAEVEQLHGAALFRTLRHHAEHDVDHGAEVLRQIDLLTPARRAIVQDNALQTARYMALATHTFIPR